MITGVDVLAFQQVAVVAVDVGLGAGDLGGLLQVPVVGVEMAARLTWPRSARPLMSCRWPLPMPPIPMWPMVSFPLAPWRPSTARTPEGMRQGQACGGGGRREELTSLELVHGGPPFAVRVIHIPRDTGPQLNRRPGRLQAGRGPSTLPQGQFAPGGKSFGGFAGIAAGGKTRELCGNKLR